MVSHENFSPGPVQRRPMPSFMVGVETDKRKLSSSSLMANVSLICFVCVCLCVRRSEGRHRVRHQDCGPAERSEKHAPSGQSQNTYVTSLMMRQPRTVTMRWIFY